MGCTLVHYLRILEIHELSGLGFDSVLQPEQSRVLRRCPGVAKIHIFLLRHAEAREILLDQVMNCFIHSGLSRANEVPRSLKEETYCCLRQCWQDALVVRSCNHLFFLAMRGG
jgi:hypothetical protein